MSGNIVRQTFMKEFTGFTKNSRLTAMAILGSYFAQIIGAVVFGYWLLKMSGGWLTWCGVGAAMLFIATRLRGLNNIIHECSHNTFVRDRQDNTICGSICATLVMSCYHDYRSEHMTHHAHLGDYDKDLDLQGIQDLHLEEELTLRTVLRHIFTPILGLHLPYYLGVNLSGRDGKFYQAAKMALIAAAIVFLILDPIAALLLVWVPFLWIYSALNYWTDCMDHAGLLENGDELEASRNILAPGPLKLLLFPRNDCYHLVHHLFPQVPSNKLAECHGKLLENELYSKQAEQAARAAKIQYA